MNASPFLIPLLVEDSVFVKALVDSGCDCFSAISGNLVSRLRMDTIEIPPRPLAQATGIVQNTIVREMVSFKYDIDGWRSQATAYVIPDLEWDVVLGLPWMMRVGGVLDPERGTLRMRRAGNLTVKECALRERIEKEIGLKHAEDLNPEDRKYHAGFATSLFAINAVLSEQNRVGADPPQTGTPSDNLLPPELEQYRDLFDKDKASGLPPHRGAMDHHIKLAKDEEGRQPDLPWGPLYSMPRDHLLEVRKQITDLMDKGWIRSSSSSAGAPVLLAKKPGGKWRFCVDYRSLNKLTVPDRYPLPLIKETLRNLSTAKWFTKVDVRSAFHRIRIAEGDEHLTAFRTRFGLFEWLVCPFGLTGAPSTFQRYINNALRETLGHFATAYLDDVLIYSNGSRADHLLNVGVVLSRLREAKLYLDPEKCVFATKTVHYLGFVVEAGKSLRPDPEKIRAIRDWEPPKNVKGVRSFLGFANFYRDFIDHFSDIATPLHNLTKHGTDFHWGDREENAFNKLKEAFISGPILLQWDPDRDTVVEADCSGGALGGCLSQMKNGILHPVAYHSASLTAEQRNYTIHDKELTAVVKCIEAWTPELISVRRPFTVLTDHKNLEYFTRARTLSERQHRWSESLSRFRYKLQFRPGHLAARPDALSRRDQDMRGNQRTESCVMNPVAIRTTRTGNRGEPDPHPRGAALFADTHMQRLWDDAMKSDGSYLARLKAVRGNARTFPPEADTKQQIGDCTLSAHGTLLWRGVTWLPSWEPLTTTVIQRAHESNLSGHPGKNTTFQIIRRDYHWDGMSEDVARYVRNCHCYGAHASRLKRQGLLQPIPVADRFWSQISMDFMTELPQEEEDSPKFLLVITDRLSKYVQLEAMTSMTSEACADRFRDTWWRFHGFPSSIITDRGSDWLGHFWKTLCKIVKIEQLLSTAHHPQTDGGTERMNQEVQAVLRVMINFSQTDWPLHLPACQLALNNRDSSVTGLSPNLLVNGYTMAPIQTQVETPTSAKTPKGRAAYFVEHLRDGWALTQAAIVFTQQRQQESTNLSRRPAERFQVGDKVWFSTRNVKTVRASRKLDWLQVKYTVTAVPTPLTVTLDLPGNLHKTVHVDLVERAPYDPLPSQELEDNRPGPALGLEEEDESLREWKVEEILAEKRARGRNKKQLLVKWEGWLNPTWHPKEDFEETEALQRFKEREIPREG